MRWLEYSQWHAQQNLEGQRAKKLKKLSHTGCVISENRFWFWTDQEKNDWLHNRPLHVFTDIRYTRIWRAEFTTVSLHNHFSVIILPIITNYPPPPPHARYLNSKHSLHLHLLYSISESNLWLTLSPGYYKL